MKTINYKKEKSEAVIEFDKLIKKARKLLKHISKGTKIELLSNGVNFAMIDPFSDFGDISDVVSVEGGVIELDNGTSADVEDVTNLTDLIGLLETIDE